MGWECKVLHPGRSNPMHWDMLGANWLESSFEERTWGPGRQQ